MPDISALPLRCHFATPPLLIRQISLPLAAACFRHYAAHCRHFHFAIFFAFIIFAMPPLLFHAVFFATPLFSLIFFAITFHFRLPFSFIDIYA